MGTVMGLVDPVGELVHDDEDKSELSCSKKPGISGSQAMVTLPGEAGAIVRVGKPARTETLSKKRDWIPVPEEVPLMLIEVEEDVATKLKLKLLQCIPVPEGVNVKDLLELPAVTRTVLDPLPAGSF